MNKEEIINYWRRFFADLLVGTFIKLLLFGLIGFVLGLISLFIMDHFVMEELEWSTWIVSTVLVLSFGWYTGFGVFYGLIACIIQTSSKKITEALAGLHDLLDLLTHGVVEKIPRFNKNIPRNQLEDTFDGIGKNFLEQLRLKRGVTAFLSRILFGTILKVIKFFFLDNVVEELSKKESDITSSDIEHAVRRVGVEMVIAPILEKFLYLQIFNFILFTLSFAAPIGVLLLF
ncbi:MAG TPA: hypothetical protein EYN22_00155 [Nitrospinaceae bacterium]|nr:hypothetical protein [Nitrospinaceae bacterium]